MEQPKHHKRNSLQMEKKLPLAAQEKKHSEESLGYSSLQHAMEYLAGTKLEGS